MRIVDAQLILPSGIQPGGLEISQGRIRSVETKQSKKKRGGEETISLEGGFLAPGFIDLHIHGALGHDFMDATPEAFRAITEFHFGGGTTSLTPTTVTAS